ncbi:MAG: glycogen synthase, partial [Akkermansiaceae bacterium]|nr:glycogen synthase [Akkermansiaceae bacterium]
FWQHLFYNHLPDSYEETRGSNPCDLLASGIAAADHVTTVSPNFLSEILEGYHECVPL